MGLHRLRFPHGELRDGQLIMVQLPKELQVLEAGMIIVSQAITVLMEPQI